MMDTFDDLRKLKPGDLQIESLEWLKKCWNCGDEIEDERSGLCGDCLDYWDKKTR